MEMEFDETFVNLEAFGPSPDDPVA